MLTVRVTKDDLLTRMFANGPKLDLMEWLFFDNNALLAPGNLRDITDLALRARFLLDFECLPVSHRLLCAIEIIDLNRD